MGSSAFNWLQPMRFQPMQPLQFKPLELKPMEFKPIDFLDLKPMEPLKPLKPIKWNPNDHKIAGQRSAVHAFRSPDGNTVVRVDNGAGGQQTFLMQRSANGLFSSQSYQGRRK